MRIQVFVVTDRFGSKDLETIFDMIRKLHERNQPWRVGPSEERDEYVVLEMGHER